MNQKDDYGRNCIWIAANAGQIEMMKYLYDNPINRFDPNECNSLNINALGAYAMSEEGIIGYIARWFINDPIPREISLIIIELLRSWGCVEFCPSISWGQKPSEKTRTHTKEELSKDDYKMIKKCIT